MILIVTNQDDPHSDDVVRRISETNQPFFRVNTENVLSRSSISVFDVGGSRIVFSTPFGEFSDLDVKSILYRRPKPSIPNHMINDPHLKIFAQKESDFFLFSLWSLMGDKFWMNHPNLIRPFDSKLFQYKIAGKIGLKYPKSIITNNPNEALEFIGRFQNVVVKPISGGFVRRPAGNSMLYTNKLDQSSIKKIDLVKYSPTFFQEYIPKLFELRITIVFGRVFTCKINSQDSLKTKDDWRRYDFDNVKHEVFLLPDSISEKLIEFMKICQLNFGAIDMIVTPEGEYIFLERKERGLYPRVIDIKKDIC